MKKHKTSLFIFRRDLRLEDNTALIEALKDSEEVIPCFIFDPRQMSKMNEYLNTNALGFMKQSLDELNQELKKHKSHLFTFFGETEEVLRRFLEKKNAEAVYLNKDYTPFSKERDLNIKKICEENNCTYYEYEDIFLTSPTQGLKKDKTPYTIFTAYYNNSKKITPKLPQKNKYNNYSKKEFSFENKSMLINLGVWVNENAPTNGGRKEGLKILKELNQQKEYYFTRNFPSKKTTHISPHLKFGTISVRETYFKILTTLGENHPLIRQLYWKDFFTQIGYFFPKVFGSNFNKKFDYAKWDNSEEKFIKWCKGETGHPIVDAGMNELNTTGFMHNRVRMITASFLVKDLHIDWRKGEKYFAQKLIDYDPCVNNGNWQWVAGTGCDAAPYFRIFNPWIQQKKFDPNTEYIKR